MGDLSILIAQSSDSLQKALQQALGDRYVVHVCGTGREALDLLRNLRPEVLVLDLMLPELDGLSLLETIASEGIRPQVLATTAIITSYIQESAQALGIDYIIRTPCCVEAVAMRVTDMAESGFHIKEMVAEILAALGFNPKQNGTKCLPNATALYARNPAQALTKELYPAVGKLCTPPASGNKVEKDIRYAIDCAWVRGNQEQWKLYFNFKEKPTNGEFIAKLVELTATKRLHFR